MQLERIKSLVETGVKEGAQKYQAAAALPESGCFYPPTLLWDVQPSSTVAIEEIFGPVLVAMTFRTPDEAVALANNTRYGLAASVWSETIGLALDIAPKLKAGVVWINATNLFDASVGFGGYRESGFGREGGREGIYEYLKPKAWSGRKPRATLAARIRDPMIGPDSMLPPIDRTPKLFIGGKQVRPDGNYSRAVLSPKGKHLGEVGEGNRKDIRNAVAAARGAEAWANATQHNRAQILYYLAENLSARGDEFTARIAAMTATTNAKAKAEVEASIARLFSYGAWADKYEGAVHMPPLRGVALAMHEPIGVVGVACPDEAPLLGVRQPGRAADRHGQPCRRRAERAASARRDRLLSGARDLRRAGRRGQHRHRRPRGPCEGAGRARRCRCALGVRLEGGFGDGGEALGRQSQAHAGRSWTDARLVRRRCLGRADPAPTRSAGEEYLDSLWRLATRPNGTRTAKVGPKQETEGGGTMLKTIDPLLNADVLYALRAMGHGDRLVICDTNFPADSIARQTVFGESAAYRQCQRRARQSRRCCPCCRSTPSSMTPPFAWRSSASPKEVPPVQQEVQAAIDRAEGKSWPLVGVERHAFYELAKTAYCVIATGERRFYGCFLFTKGVIPPDGEHRS